MTDQSADHAGFTLLELMVVLSIIALIAAITIVGVARARSRGAEASAINALRTIHSAQDAFRALCGHGRDFASSLDQLGAAQTISPDLSGATVVKQRYTISLTPTAPGQAPDSCTQKKTAAHWYASAAPLSPQSLRGFATTDDDDIWQDATGTPPPVPFTPSKTVSRLEPF